MFYSNYRGSQRGRWPARNFMSRSNGRARVDMAQPVQVTTPSPVGQLLERISDDDILTETDDKTEGTRITGCELIASYNWMDKPGASIVIPGMPPKWTPLPSPQKLKEDAGIYYRDRNAAQYPDHPMEPAAEAIMKANSSLEKAGFSGPEDIDIVACGSTLGNLLRFVRGEDRPCRMLVEVVGRTVHLVRRENSPRETIPDVRGYGHTFPEAYTSWDPSIRGSLSHQRILRYRFGGLSCIVRFEGDGYLPEKTGAYQASASSAKKDSMSSVQGEKASLEELTSALAEHGVSGASPGAKSSLQISDAGESVPQRAVFDLKTRSIRRMPDQDKILKSELPRLWLSQIPNFVLAYHSCGRFNDIEIQDVRPAIRKWESEKEAELRRFGKLLRKIVNIAREKSDGKLEIVRNAGEDFLQIREQMPDIPPASPPETGERWKRWLGGLEGNFHSDEREAEKDWDGIGTKADGNASDGLFDLCDEKQNYTACDEECGYCGHCV